MAKASDTQHTPAMKQFHRFKEQYPGTVLFFRMGDFYEMFYEDAELVARVLGITLTARAGTGSRSASRSRTRPRSRGSASSGAR